MWEDAQVLRLSLNTQACVEKLPLYQLCMQPREYQKAKYPKLAPINSLLDACFNLINVSSVPFKQITRKQNSIMQK